jgi:hypothetical protein
VEDAVITSCRVRLRPILMTSLATIIGMLPMALKMGTGSEQYAPLALAIIGGLISVGHFDRFHCSRSLSAGVRRAAGPGQRTQGGWGMRHFECNFKCIGIFRRGEVECIGIPAFGRALHGIPAWASATAPAQSRHKNSL